MLRWVFRAMPMPEAMRDRVRQRVLNAAPALIPPPEAGQWHGDDSPQRPRRHAGGRAIGYRERTDAPLPDPLPARLVAFYLPQFHPIPENDAWWGPGFTEWRNVTRALPQFEGHAQPRLPGDLGFYDLRLPDTLRAQTELARAYGISAFCSYFYWFGGKTLLDTPLRQWLGDTSIDFPICLCWANENWSRRWDGREQDILIGQSHSPDDDLAFIAHIAAYLRDPRYLRVDGRPVLLVYRTGLLPDPRATAERWRGWCRENGVGEIHLACVHSFERDDPRSIGFDAAVEFPPNLSSPASLTAEQRLLNPDYQGEVLDWRELAGDWAKRGIPAYPMHPAVNCGWDNEPRRPGRGRTYLHASPRGYRDWLEATLRNRLPRSGSDLVFINAWNEWAEGAVLEPDLRLGHAWLEATREALFAGTTPRRTVAARRAPPENVAIVVHAWYPDVLPEILGILGDAAHEYRLVITVPAERRLAVETVLRQQDTHAEIVEVENRGRDILPFLQVAGRLLDEGVDVVLKLHTKRSTHREDGDTWRHELLQRLAAPDRFRAVLAAFAEDPALGVVGPEGHMQPLHYHWSANERRCLYLCRRTGISAPATDADQFIAGSMAWFRLASLRPLLDAHLQVDEFEDEEGQLDGTLAHAIERVFLLIMKDAGFRVMAAAECAGLPPQPESTGYRFAGRPRSR
ncbi:glycoside hydrolase family 99-like domain-containing protein [Luteimonas sp. MHLX1A]|uniref:glycoside hydrolase family 99-like domain-containing protein n=1 Tax=Alterluteimonas muca TaxID=2878684 RepID=UPI001E5168B4|nr:glycoside hydrolase family 99-like domain-containing protein [Luteimonas sp. MHLX1A]MCD9047986.1 glycoside hydrolase family 99-like domain-containing protein [Luteimonas sp. MHLX1A]